MGQMGKWKEKRGKYETYHGLALCARRVDGELVRYRDDEVVSGTIPGRSGINDLDGHVEDHI